MGRFSHVNQASQMKSKNNAQYIQQLVQDEKNATSGKFELIRLWNKRELDFRLLTSLRNMLFSSNQFDANNKIPASEFQRIRAEHDHQHIRQQLLDTEDLLLREITEPATGLCDLNQFSELIDMYMFLPNTEKVND